MLFVAQIYLNDLLLFIKGDVKRHTRFQLGVLIPDAGHPHITTDGQHPDCVGCPVFAMREDFRSHADCEFTNQNASFFRKIEMAEFVDDH